MWPFLKQLVCPCCGKRGELVACVKRLDAQGNRVEIRVCSNCTALVNVTELQAALENPNAALSAQTSSSEHFYDANPVEAVKQASRAEGVIRFLLCDACPAVGRRTAIDFGAGMGHMAAAACKYFDCVYAIDSNSTTLRRLIPAYGTKNLFVAGEIDDVPGVADAILVWHTFEHLPDAYRVAGRLAAKLKRGGVLFWQVPMYRDATVVHTHYTFFNETSAHHFSRAAGLRLDAVWHDEENQFLTGLSRRG